MGLCEDLDWLDQDVELDDPEVRPRPEFHGFDVRFVRFEAVGITFSLYGVVYDLQCTIVARTSEVAGGYLN